jgi:hypothetical protein
LKDWNIFGLICLSGSGSKSTLKSLHSKPHLVQRPNSDLHNIIANSKLSVDRSMDGQGWGNNRIGFGGVGWDGAEWHGTGWRFEMRQIDGTG